MNLPPEAPMRGDIIIVEDHHRAAAAQIVDRIADTVAAKTKPDMVNRTVSALTKPMLSSLAN